METCDIAIVGGGPAGSSCAWSLKESGLDIVILDKAVFPRHKVCGGWITPSVTQELKIDLNDYGASRILQPITSFRTGYIGGNEVHTDYGQPVSYGIRRCEFDHYLLQRSGARLMLGESLHSLRRDADRWIINERLQASLVIGAGGTFCPVARMLTTKPESEDSIVMAQEIEFEMTPQQASECRVAGETPELYFCDDLQGYGWCFRKGNFLNIGLGRENEQRLSSHVEAFRDFLQERGKVPRDLPTHFHGHAYHLYGHAPHAVQGDRVLLIGDAVGLAYPQSGEGIRPAVESGLLAASVIQIAAGNYNRDLAGELRAQLAKRFGRPGDQSPHSRLLPGPWTQFLARQFLSTHWFTRHILLDRWFLHRHMQPLSI